MATLVVHSEGAAPSFVPLVKPLTTLAAAADSDVRVPDLRGVVAIQFDGESFIATALEGAHLVVNGKRRGQHTLADGDTMELGGTLSDEQRLDLLRVAAKCPVHRLMTAVTTEVSTRLAPIPELP